MLVEITGKQNDEQLITTSLKVAEKFQKQHKDVLENIRNLMAENSAAKLFEESTYESRGKRYPIFKMGRDGFSLLAMGFTGEKALKWKLEYIQAFNAMEGSWLDKYKPQVNARGCKHYRELPATATRPA